MLRIDIPKIVECPKCGTMVHGFTFSPAEVVEGERLMSEEALERSCEECGYSWRTETLEQLRIKEEVLATNSLSK